MAYAKKTWVSGETPLSAENMNNIENGIANAHEDIRKLNTNNITAIALENSATGALTMQKIGKKVYLTGDIDFPDSYTTDASFRIATLPYRPTNAYCFFTGFRGYSSVTGTPCRGHVTTEGVVQVFCPAGSSGSLRFSKVFFIK